MNTARSWPEFFDSVREHAAVYFGAEDVQQTYLNPNLEIDFDVDDLAHSVNAHARKVSAGKYEIRLNAGLLEVLDRHAVGILERYPELFVSGDGEEVSRDDAAAYLMFLWTDFVICHEWGHIVSGHLEFSGATRWDEFQESSQITSRDLRHAFELEADSRASTFVLAGLASRWREVALKLYSGEDPCRAWRDFIYANLMLFDFFRDRQEHADREKSTHPDPFIRAFTFQIFVLGERHRVEGLPEITGDANQFFGNIVVEYYMRVRGGDAGEYVQQLLEARDVCQSVDAILERSGVKRHRITKAVDSSGQELSYRPTREME